MRIIFALIALAGLAGCGTTAPNADVPQGFYAGLGDRPEIAPRDDIAIVETGPSVQDGGRRVGGTSCKNKIWDPAPSKERAIALMKQQAAALGMNAVHSVEVRNEPAALALNCWSAIVAGGIAFHRDPAPVAD